MSEWKEYKFSDFVEINPNVTLPSDECISYVEMKDLNESEKFCFPSSERKKGNGSKFQNYDTLFARITPCLENGKICQVRGLKNNVGLGSTEFIVFRGKRNVSDTDFIFYLSRWDDVRSHAEINLDGTSGRQRVPIACFDDLIIKMPVDIDEQKAIASILSSLDDKIDLLHRQNATLEKMAETLFRQWFVEEDNDDTISQLISIQNGYAFKSKDFRENGIHGVIKIKNISDGIIDIEKTDFIENEIAKSAQERFKIRTGDILIAMTGAEIGKLGIIPKTNKNLWLNQRVGLLKEKFRGSKYLAYLQLKSEFGQDYIENTATGSAQPNISGTGIENCGFPKLSEKQIKEYSYQIGELFEKVIFNLGQIKTLTELRNMLLPKLMSGEIRVESHRDETSVETNNDTATLSPVGAAFKTIKHG